LKDKEFTINTRRGYIETITIHRNFAIMPLNMQTDIFDIQEKNNQLLITLQTTGTDELTVYNRKNGKTIKQVISKAGIHHVRFSY